eukprot:TRINITY_DN78019_c0_g1_i1.p1 TRINITY_DN78019_c0_g1~~TRINITY_DN78019_c0_g1_i1.p1  ORF type:complete len:445 (-),score=39.72 TRINITY_DN78019_c0_g1_i1:109-1368(-)
MATSVETEPLRDHSTANHPEIAVSAVNTTGESQPARVIFMIPMVCVFQAYGAYAGLQHFLKTDLAANDDGWREHYFTLATTLMHWGKLLSRCGHDLVFPCFSTWVRVQIAMMLAMGGILVPLVMRYMIGSQWIGIAFLHYGLLGVGVGIFEATYLSLISPLGHETKAWAIVGVPLGFGIVDVLAFILHSKLTLHLAPVWFFFWVAFCLPFGVLVVATKAPRHEVTQQVNIFEALRDWKSWLLAASPFLIAKFASSFVMENTPAWFKIYNAGKVPMFSPSATDHLMDADFFFALVQTFVLLGDTLSRKAVYLFKLETPQSNIIMLCLAVVTSIVGFFLQSFIMGVVTVLAGFLAFWGNGMAYALSTKYFDRFVSPAQNRSVYSLWCMIGDCAGIIASYLVVVVSDFFCGSHSYPYACHQK